MPMLNKKKTVDYLIFLCAFVTYYAPPH